MKTRKRTFSIAAIVLLAAGLAAGLALAQNSEEVAETSESEVTEMTFIARVAANLGVEESALTDAMELARIQKIDEAVADGRLTEEQAERMKARIEARQAIQEVIGNAIASGELTEEQAELLNLRGEMSRGLAGLRGIASELREERSDSGFGGFGFMVRTPRGAVSGRICRRP